MGKEINRRGNAVFSSVYFNKKTTYTHRLFISSDQSETSISVIVYKNDVMRLGERPRSLEGKPNYLDLPFAIKLYYSMSTISYTPWFSYQINMTLIECSRIRKTRPFAWRSDSGRHDSMLVSFQHPGLRIVVVRLCPNVYHSSEYVLDLL